MLHLEGFVAPSKQDFVKLKRQVSSWPKTAKLIYETKDPMEVYKLMFVERTTLNRDYNIIRLYQRFNRLRCNEELRNLSSFLIEIPIYTELKEHLVNQTKLNIFLDQVGQSKDLYLQLLKMEYLGLNRHYMIKLLHGRFQKLRRSEEIRTI